MNSLASRTFFIDFYRNLAADPSGYGEGQFYVGSVGVTTDGSGNAVFALTNTAGNYAGQYFTATATSAGGDTSEFGLAVLATNQPAPSAQFTGPLTWRTNGFVLTLALQTNFSYRLQAATNLASSSRLDRADQLPRHQFARSPSPTVPSPTSASASTGSSRRDAGNGVAKRWINGVIVPGRLPVPSRPRRRLDPVFRRRAWEPEPRFRK